MAAKVALTAEEFRENSQRSIDLFNTEKLSTNSTHVLKSAYCNSVHFCRCNLHGACGGKGVPARYATAKTRVAICTGRVEAKCHLCDLRPSRSGCNLHGACGGKDVPVERLEGHLRCNLHGACGGKVMVKAFLDGDEVLQSARSVWRQSPHVYTESAEEAGCNLHGACGGKGGIAVVSTGETFVAICTERVEAKIFVAIGYSSSLSLQSARGVWRQRTYPRSCCQR